MNKILYFYTYFSIQDVKYKIKNYFNLLIFTLLLSLGLKPNVGFAQTLTVDQQQESTTKRKLPEIPSPQKLFEFPSIPPTPRNTETLPEDIPRKITVNSFEVEGSTVFSKEELDKATEDLDW